MALDLRSHLQRHNMPTSDQRYDVRALYKFVHLDNFEALRQPLLDCMMENHVRGTLLLAHEGVNGTIAGSREGVDAVLNWLNADDRLTPIDIKESFHQLKRINNPTPSIIKFGHFNAKVIGKIPFGHTTFMPPRFKMLHTW